MKPSRPRSSSENGHRKLRKLCVSPFSPSHASSVVFVAFRVDFYLRSAGAIARSPATSACAGTEFCLSSAIGVARTNVDQPRWLCAHKCLCVRLPGKPERRQTIPAVHTQDVTLRCWSQDFLNTQSSYTCVPERRESLQLKYSIELKVFELFQTNSIVSHRFRGKSAHFVTDNGAY